EEYAGKWSNGFGRRDLPDDDEPELWRFNMRRPNNWNDLVAKFEDDVMALARELIDKGADPFAKDRLGRSVFWHVCNKCWLKSIPWFAEMGAKLEERDRDEVSVFEAGCLCMDSWVLNPMLKLGYDINARDANGDTVLLKLARTNGERNNHCVVIMRLLEAGADPKLENAKGESYAKMAETDKNLAYALEWAERYRERDKK
ncbi:MAG: hypothetical protein K2H64_05155, partial [Desulfovibrio sp.]|nr:hypothetical protein [Desulfovibrio sp.]